MCVEYGPLPYVLRAPSAAVSPISPAAPRRRPAAAPARGGARHATADVLEQRNVVVVQHLLRRVVLVQIRIVLVLCARRAHARTHAHWRVSLRFDATARAPPRHDARSTHLRDTPSLLLLAAFAKQKKKKSKKKTTKAKREEKKNE